MPIEIISVSLTEAAQAVATILDRTRSDEGAPVAIAITDATGRLICFSAMDHVTPASIKLAQSKAYSAVIGQSDTIRWASIAKNENTVDFDMRNWTDQNFSGFTGGVVITLNGQVIGGIGVSGRKGKMDRLDTILQDNELANYGKEIIEAKLTTNGIQKSTQN